MRHKLLMGAGMALCAVAAMAGSDPIIMKIGDISVPKSEFEYLYHKNAQQQISAQPLDEYVEMFKIYKMKVADAKAAGIDTTAAFLKEMAQYREELAAPYLTDSAYIYELARQQYDLLANDREVKHIMIKKSPKRADNVRTYEILDSLRTLLINGADLGRLAAQYSEDKMSKDNGGSMGYAPATLLPYEFQEVLYNTPEGEVSEICESPMYWHIIVGGKDRPSRGRVHVAHILKRFPQNATEEQRAQTKAQADSLYALVKADPSRFAEIAKQNSDDPASAQAGGDLKPFAAGYMAAPFENVAFDLADGEIGGPVQTRYGWHIILKKESLPLQSFEEMKPTLVKRVTDHFDPRAYKIIEHQNEKLGQKFKLKVNDKLFNKMMDHVAVNGVDSTFYVIFSEAPIASQTLFSTKRGPKTVGEFVTFAKGFVPSYMVDGRKQLVHCLDQMINNDLRVCEMKALEAEVPEYRNLMQEYRDGSLLYEISLRNVWDRASKDTEGLQRYFEQNRDDFKWSEPRVKGILVMATTDKIANKVRKRLEALPKDEAIQSIRDEFKRNVQIDKVIVKRGDNALVDYIMFTPGEGQPPLNEKYPSYFLFDPVIINEPEEVDDVRGLVTSAYQDQLEQDWVHDMKARYQNKIKVNEKVLKQIK